MLMMIDRSIDPPTVRRTHKGYARATRNETMESIDSDSDRLRSSVSVRTESNEIKMNLAPPTRALTIRAEGHTDPISGSVRPVRVDERGHEAHECDV
jgi:hypothetical protein